MAEEEVRGPHTARILVTLNRKKNPLPSAQAIIQRLQQEVGQIWEGQAKYLLYANSVEGFFGTDKAPLVIEVQGPRLERLKQASQEIIDQVKIIPGLVNLRSNLLAGNPQVSIIPDRTMLSEVGIDLRQLGSQIRDQLTGRQASLMKDQDGERDPGELLRMQPARSTLQDGIEKRIERHRW